VDATCARVRANQLLAQKKADEGFRVVIIGDGGHPEVVGINGWAYHTAIVAGSFEELAGQLDRVIPGDPEHGGGKRLCVIAQTTFNKESYAAICAAIKKRYPDSEVHDTICAATVERQSAARELAGRRDAMIVIGGADSANTRQLYRLCADICGETYLIESAGGLPPIDILRGKRVGITAGASTPDWIIEEVVEKMEEMKRLDGDIDFAEEMESSLVTLQVGQTVKGRIIRHNSTEVYVDLGYKSDGVIPIDEFVTDTEQDPANNIVIDAPVDVFIVRVNDSEGTVQLSKKRVDEKNNWSRIEEAFENASPIKAVVTDVTNGGLIVTSSGVRIFVPASQVSDRYVEDLRGYLRKPVEIRIIDYNKQKRKFVGSMKVLIIEDKRRAAEQLWDEIDVGREYDGTVKSLTAFGAFVDIGGVDGLVHISELSWSRIKHPSDVVKVGEKIAVRVISLDRDKKKISLGYRREEDNPWYNIEGKYPVGSVVTKKVVRIAPFGAFVELERGIDALVHISQISDTRIAKPDDVLHVGMEVTAKITELNLETKKISISIKEVEPIPYIAPVTDEEQAAAIEEDELPTEHVEEMRTTLGDMLKSAVGDMDAADADEQEAIEPEAVEPEAIEPEAETSVEADEPAAEADEAEAVEPVVEADEPEAEVPAAVVEPETEVIAAIVEPKAEIPAVVVEPVTVAVEPEIPEETPEADADAVEAEVEAVTVPATGAAAPEAEPATAKAAEQPAAAIPETVIEADIPEVESVPEPQVKADVIEADAEEK